MGLVLGLIYFVGLFGSLVVGRSRAGLTQLGRLNLATIFTSLEWFVHQLASLFLWPIFLVVWLARGRPESPWRSETTARGTLRVVRVR